jgi:hypothetical protein
MPEQSHVHAVSNPFRASRTAAMNHTLVTATGYPNMTSALVQSRPSKVIESLPIKTWVSDCQYRDPAREVRFQSGTTCSIRGSKDE